MFAFAQEGIRFSLDSVVAPPVQIPVAAPIPDSTATPSPTAMPVLVPTPVSATTPAPVAIPTPTTLDLEKLSAKGQSFETYSANRALLADSIAHTNSRIDSVTQAATANQPALAPKGEFEKQTEFDQRKKDREAGLSKQIGATIKPFEERRAALQKADGKIKDIQSTMLSSLEVQTTPAVSKITLNGKDSVFSPATFKDYAPGEIRIQIEKQDYEPRDTLITLLPSTKLKLSFTLEEKSIFSVADEINIRQILAQDTPSVAVYRARIERIRARQIQVDEEIAQIITAFPAAYPQLDSQKPDETAEQFSARQTEWMAEGQRRVGVLRQKHQDYSARLDRTAEVLEDYIIADESRIITEFPLTSEIALGAYDADKEHFELTVQDTAGTKSPFVFAGSVGIPVATAKEMNRSTAGFAVSIQYLNYPFRIDTVSVNLAMQKLNITHNTKPVTVVGEFKEIPYYVSQPGYASYKTHSDFLLAGTIKPRGLDIAYALGKQASADAAIANQKSGSGLGWRGWSRIGLSVAAAALGAIAVNNHLKADDESDKFKGKKLPPAGPDRDAFIADIKKANQNISDYENSRNIMGIGAGVCVGLGVLTFVF
ncbi:hypothetical protein AGMMS49938_17480 [Fibrobacterales bacterium]|nr:hypothetical protein AGMMS49938_17480 [Fibrobacterales bacterium]